MTDILKELIPKYRQEIKNNNLLPLLKEAITKNVLEEMLEDFAVSGIAIAPNVVFDALWDRYIESSAKLTPKEGEKRKPAPRHSSMRIKFLCLRRCYSKCNSERTKNETWKNQF